MFHPAHLDGRTVVILRQAWQRFRIQEQGVLSYDGETLWLGDLDVEVRVAPAPMKPLLSKAFCEEDVMYDAWCELPRFEPIGEVIPEPGASFLPDIPQNDETDG